MEDAELKVIPLILSSSHFEEESFISDPSVSTNGICHSNLLLTCHQKVYKRD